ncbi:unnamed protein product, partial [Effrenium voratum]
SDRAARLELNAIGGSHGHPELCRPPCLHFVRRACPNGEKCFYCHLPHPTRPVILDKRLRQAAGALDDASFLALVLPVLRHRMDWLQPEVAKCAEELIRALEREELPEVTENRLQRRMLNMSFAALVNLLSVR